VASLLAVVISAAFTGLFTGTPASPQGIAEALSVIGLNDGQDPQHVAQHLASINLAVLTNVVQTATREHWEAARDDLAGMLAYMDVRRRVEACVLPEERRLGGLADLPLDDPVSHALLMPALIIVATSEWRQRLESQLAQWRAVDRLLSAIPDKFHRFISQDREDVPSSVELRWRSR
jgi:hypothetical protein